MYLSWTGIGLARSPYTDRQHTEISLREGASPKGGCEDGATGFTRLPHSFCAQKSKPIHLGMTVLRLGGGNVSPKAGCGCAGARCHRSRPARVPATGSCRAPRWPPSRRAPPAPQRPRARAGHPRGVTRGRSRFPLAMAIATQPAN